MAGNGRAGTSSALMGSGDAFMPRFSEKRLTRLVQKEKNTLARFRLLACLGRKKGRSIRRIAGDLGFAYSTARDWLVRILERGLKGRYNKKPPGRKRKLSPSTIRVVRRRLKKSPQKYGFESGSWQLDMAAEMIRRDFSAEVKPRTLRRWMKRIKFSWRKSRHVPHKSASKKEQEEFKRKAGCRAAQERAAGKTVLAADEASVQMAQNPNYGWRPTGGREQTKTTFSTRAVKIIGAISQDGLRIKIVDSANSETFQEFLEEIRQDCGPFYMVLDNVSYHKSKAILKYVESKGDVELEFLPPYTPQLNPIETVWRDLKRRLSGRFFHTIEELKAAITAIVKDEMGNRLKGYLAA